MSFGKRDGGVPSGRVIGGSPPVSHSPVRQAYAPPRQLAVSANPPDAQLLSYDMLAPTFQAAPGETPTGGVRFAAKPVMGLRWASGALDYVILCVLIALIFVVLAAKSADGSEPDVGAMLSAFGVVALLAFCYGLIMDWAYGGTIGKLATGTRVVDADGDRISFMRSLGRNAGKVLSYLVPFYIAYLMVFWTKDRQTLHDMMAGTKVYKKDDLIADRAAVFS